jgi:pentalenic acid synthase
MPLSPILAWRQIGGSVRVVTQKLIGRLPGLRLAVPASELEFKPGMAIHSLRELPVLWGEP